MSEFNYSELAEHLSEVESTAGPAGFHGQLAGLWCRYRQLPADLGLDGADQQAEAWTWLLDFAQRVKDALDDSDCGFVPLLPPDHAPLALRVEALAEWSEGLLFGIGAAGALAPSALSAEIQELLRDLSEICKITVDEDEDGAEDAYVEIVEYLKVVAQTLYVELHPQAG